MEGRCFLARIAQTEQPVLICRANSGLISAQFMHGGYLQQQGSSSQEHRVTTSFGLSGRDVYRFLSSDLDLSSENANEKLTL